jgi:hypothetical protein
MLSPQICERFTNESEPRVSIDALFDLRRLIDAQRPEKTPQDHGRAESPSGGNNAQQGKLVQLATQAALRGRRDVDCTAGVDKRTVPDSLAPAADKRSQNGQREAE